MSKIQVDTSATECLLNEWGKWSRMSLGLNIGTPSGGNVYCIDDDTALLIDGLVGYMGKASPTLKEVAILTYQKDHNYPMLANSLKVGETKARQLHQAVIAWIDGALAGFTYEVDVA